MENKEYQKCTAKTDIDYDRVNIVDNRIKAILHGCIGINTESGELMSCVKKHIIYEQPLDVINIKEELGDLLWYISCICNAMGISMSKIMDGNIKKLKKRYPDGFTKRNANIRLDKEGEK